jgi:hypothetical protein
MLSTWKKTNLYKKKYINKDGWYIVHSNIFF